MTTSGTALHHDLGVGPALVVGASSAIGTALAGAVADLGFDLTLWGRDPERLERTASASRSYGASVSIDVLDLRGRSAVALWP